MNIPIYKNDNAYYVAWRIERILMVHALGEYAVLYDEAPEYQSKIAVVQHIELLQSLLQSGDERFTYEVRMTSYPDGDQPNRGSIAVHCIVAMQCDDIADAHTHALGIYRLFNAHFRDVVWDVVDDVVSLLHAHEVQHAVSLTRTGGFILQDHSVTDTVYGLVRQPVASASPQPTRPQGMFFLSAFVTSGHQAHAVFDYLLQHSHSVTMSIRVQRTQLTAAEMRFLQDNLDTFSDAQKYPAAVAKQLEEYQSIMNRMLLRSFALAALLNIDIVSAQEIPAQLITLVGNLITQPAGGIKLGIATHTLDYYGGFTVVHHDDVRPVVQAIRAVRMRAMPATPVHERLLHVVDVNEAAAAFQIPRSSLIPIPGMQMQSHRQLRPPSDLSDSGTVIGQYREHGVTKPIHIGEVDRTRHTYVIGQTGTGKSTVLKSMISDDITKGRGVCVIDPHGDLIDDILAQIPAERIADVIVIDPTQTDASIGLNLFEYESQEEREMAIQLFQKTVELVERARGTPMKYMDNQFWQHLRNNAYWVTQDKNDPGTIVELYNMYAIKDYYKRWLPFDKEDTKLTSWHHRLSEESYHETDSTRAFPYFSYFASKFEDFVFDSRIRAIFGQKYSTFNFFEAMNNQKIILINLSRGLLSEIASTFMGGVIMAKLQQAALKRASLPAQQRHIFSIYVDEFQNYTSDSFVSLLSESRKYGIALTLANQFLTQISNERIRGAILGNVGTIISFRIGIHDGKALQPRFAPEVEPTDLINLPNWQAYVSTQVRGQSRRPFSMQTMQPPAQRNQQTLAQVVAFSKKQYGRPKLEVERILQQSMAKERTNLTNAPAATAQATAMVSDSPTPHEIITLPTHDTPTIVLHGSGLSLWQANNQINTSQPLIRLGIHAQLQHTILTVPLAQLFPIQQRLGVKYLDFRKWCDTHQIQTLQEALTLLRYQRSIGEKNYSDWSYGDALLAYQMHQSQHDSTWRDVAMNQGLVAALDAHQRAWIWGDAHVTPAHTVPDICAIAACQTQLLLLKTDGTLLRVTKGTITAVPDIHGITQLIAGFSFGIAIDARGQMHPIYEDDSFARRLGSLPPHAAVQLVACGVDHCIAYDANQQFITWGENNFHCGVIPTELRHTQGTVVALAAGSNSSFALDGNGRLYAWGRHRLRDSTLQTLNAHRVQSIACYNNDFLCRTTDGTWWHNNQPLAIPASLAPQYITRIVGNYGDSWVAIRATDTIPAWLAITAQSITDLTGIDATTQAVLNDAGISTVGVLLQQTQAHLSALNYFQTNVVHLDALIAHINGLLGALQIATTWPQQACTLSDLVPNQPLFGWYMKSLHPYPENHNEQPTNNTDFDKSFEEFLRDFED